MPFANYKIPQGMITAEQKAEIIHKTTDMFASYSAKACAPTRWCWSTRSSTAALGAPTRFSTSKPCRR